MEGPNEPGFSICVPLDGISYEGLGWKEKVLKSVCLVVYLVLLTYVCRLPRGVEWANQYLFLEDYFGLIDSGRVCCVDVRLTFLIVASLKWIISLLVPYRRMAPEYKKFFFKLMIKLTKSGFSGSCQFTRYISPPIFRD